tara:strand:+ start:24771 stop:25022 length:252 start_codon:yes stop_codon:yes gene_type:complete
MEERIKKEILFLAHSILNDDEYNKILYYLNNNRINDVRLLISTHIDYLNELMMDDEEELLKQQLKLCDKLEDMVLNELIENEE